MKINIKPLNTPIDSVPKAQQANAQNAPSICIYIYYILHMCVCVCVCMYILYIICIIYIE
jgi:hypothetical protein